MARISVEQKALTDPRFSILGSRFLNHRLKIPAAVHHAVGLGLMVRVWNECQERGCHTLHAETLANICCVMGLPDSPVANLLVEAELGEWDGTGGNVRIKGTAGRIEWLEKSKESNRERQKRHRERNAVTNALVTPPSRGALAPSPALSPTKNSEEETTLASRSADADAPPPVLTFPTTGSGPKTWDLTPEQVGVWSGLFAGIEVEAECRKALAWIQANPKKTASGMKRFLTSWLTKATNGGGSRSVGRGLTLQERNERAGDEWLRSKGVVR